MEEMQTFRYIDVSTKLGKIFMKAFWWNGYTDSEMDWGKLSGKEFGIPAFTTSDSRTSNMAKLHA